MSETNWTPLKEGDIVDIVAPGMASTRKTLKKAALFLKSWGLVPRFSQSIFGKDLLCATNEADRLALLWKAIEAKDSQAIWCIRGGYGSFHLLSELQKKAGKKRNLPACKLFLGLSDGSSLHKFFQQEWGWPTLHASNIDRYGEGTAPQVEVKALKGLLFGRNGEISFSLKPLNAKAMGSQKIKGMVTGGNLVTCQATVGTPFQMDTGKKILFFEDIGERGYKIDRILRHFEMLGFFKQARAVIFGEFVGGREPSGQNLIPKVLKAFAEEQKIPVLAGLPTGHGIKRMPLPFGVTSTLSCGSRPQITCPSGAR